jgi:ribonuclease P protein component
MPHEKDSRPLTFPKELHVRSAKDFKRIYDRRQRAGDDLLLVFGCENELPHARLGLSVSRKVGMAVVRNRWKRLIREAFRLSQHELPPGVDLVVIPRGDVEPTLDGVQDSLRRLARQLAKKLSRGR